MKLYKGVAFISFITVIATLNASGQSERASLLEMNRRNPDGWFSLAVPNEMGKVSRHADVDGDFYLSDSMEITYDYWTNESTPNWLRGEYATSLHLACSATEKDTRTWQTRIDGNKAVLQRCSMTDPAKSSRFVHYVTFQKLRVFNGKAFRVGMFNLKVEYKDHRYSTIAAPILYSLDFQTK